MIFIIIDKIKGTVRWIRWLLIKFFCPYVVEGYITDECDMNWYGTKLRISDRQLKFRAECNCDKCPKMKEGEPWTI